MPLCASGELYLISDYRSLLSYEAFPTVAGKFKPSPAIISPEKGSEEPCIDMPIVYVVCLNLFPMPYASADFVCFPRTVVPLKRLLTSGLTCGHTLRD